MLDRLEAARARQREFVADAAHELRSPLANMRTQLEVAQRLGPAADWPAVGEDLLTDTDRLTRLVDDLLLLARTDETARVVRPVPVELGALLGRGGGALPGRRAVHAGRSDCGRRASRTRCAGWWRTCSTTPCGTPVARSRSSAAPRGADAVVTVDRRRAGHPGRPTGSGSSSGSPGSTTRGPATSGGAGLGLAIVRELVRRHGGTIRLSDAEPGLRVEVDLPATPDPVPLPAPPPSTSDS